MELITKTLPTKGKCIMYQYLIFFLNLPTKNSSMFFMSTSIPKGVPQSLDPSPSYGHLHLHRAHHGGLGCLCAFQYPRLLSQFNSRLDAIRNSSKSLITFFTLSSSPQSVNPLSFAYCEMIYWPFSSKSCIPWIAPSLAACLTITWV